MDDEHLKDLEIDVEDARKSVEDAEKEVKDARIWHSKMLVNYAKNIIELNDYKSKADLV